MKYFIRLYVSLKILITFMFLFLAVEVQIHIKLSYLTHLLIVTFNYNKLPYWLTNFSLRGVIHIKTIPERNDQFLSLYSYLFTNSVICFVTLLFFSVEAICVERVNHIWQFDIFMLQKLIVIYFCYSSSVSWETLFHHQHLSQCAEGKMVSVLHIVRNGIAGESVAISLLTAFLVVLFSKLMINELQMFPVCRSGVEEVFFLQAGLKRLVKYKKPTVGDCTANLVIME